MCGRVGSSDVRQTSKQANKQANKQTKKDMSVGCGTAVSLHRLSRTDLNNCSRASDYKSKHAPERKRKDYQNKENAKISHRLPASACGSR